MFTCFRCAGYERVIPPPAPGRPNKTYLLFNYFVVIEFVPQVSFGEPGKRTLLDHRADRTRGRFWRAPKTIFFGKTPQADTSTVGQGRSSSTDQVRYRYGDP